MTKIETSESSADAIVASQSGSLEDILSGDCVLDSSRPMKPMKIRINGAEVAIQDTVMIQANPVLKDLGNGEHQSVCDLLDADLGFGYIGPLNYSQADFEARYKTWCREVKDKIEYNGGKPMNFLISAKAFFAFYKEYSEHFEIYHPRSNNLQSLVFGIWDDDAKAIGYPKFVFLTSTLRPYRDPTLGI